MVIPAPGLWAETFTGIRWILPASWLTKAKMPPATRASTTTTERTDSRAMRRPRRGRADGAVSDIPWSPVQLGRSADGAGGDGRGVTLGERDDRVLPDRGPELAGLRLLQGLGAGRRVAGGDDRFGAAGGDRRGDVSGRPGLERGDFGGQALDLGGGEAAVDGQRPGERSEHFHRRHRVGQQALVGHL